MDQDGSDPRAWGRAQAIFRLMELQKAAAARELADPRAALVEVDELAATFASDSQVQTLVKATHAILGMTIGIGYADVPALRQVYQEMADLIGDQADPTMGTMPGFLDALQSHQSGDTSTSLALLSETLKQYEALPDSSFLRQQLVEAGPAFELMRLLHDYDPDRDNAEHTRLLAEVRSLAAKPGLTDGERALFLAVAGGAALKQGGEQDRVRIDAGIADLRKAVTLTSDDHPEHVLELASLALAVYRRSEVTGSLTDVDEAIALLERARDLAGGPAHPHWSYVNSMLAELPRRRAENLSSSPPAFDALRGYAWQVLLQPDPGSARAVAQEAAEEAIAEAGRALVGGNPSEALRVLDAGRGLALFAATELRDPCTRLIDAGAVELAKRWRSEERPSARLREEVIEVLTRETDLLDPPTFVEIQEALGRLGADALIYLVPATPPTAGWAVIAPAEGAPRFLSLPNLAVKGKLELERYLAAATERDVELPPPPTREVGSVASTEFMESLDSLCSWAWKAAIGPILKPYLDNTSDRTPRLVIIPMGELARVPWQAARRPDGKYLVQLAAVSQAASARMLCASAAATPVQPTAGGLMIADPKTGRPASDLLSARLEAYAIHRTFYPGATYIGRRPDGTVSGSGAGTLEEVLAWLQADGAHAGAMVHFATHGLITSDPVRASSRLLLAGGDLTAEELIRVLDTDRHPLGLVVLAGCHTGESIYGYDEAYSLGTVFLAAGARSVLSTQWSIPDQGTSLLMYMFHHFLITGHSSPRDALRKAQLWMLDGAREVPRAMPAPLRRMLADTDPTQIVSWAGFVHWGQ
ncbi:CHAT domain-containing protein [Kribbella sp. NPDC026611]|uniref:CHAT domain-containing protein n=1 Tax=Kribbella sp. NPDC026611 TaxID=3154911 RepID=UPI0033D5F152